jgi:hypothetical protein
MKKGSDIKNNVRQFWLRRAFPSWLIVVFSFYVLFSQANARVASFNIQETYGTSVQTDANLCHYQPAHSLFGSNPITLELKPVDESEPNESYDHDLDNLFWMLSLKQKFDLIVEKSLFLHLLLSEKNREQLSLVVLHHSWKSFLL